MGGFRRIYPNGNEEHYEKFFNQSTSLCAETASSRARTELSRLQREDIEAKQKELECYRKKLSSSNSTSTKTAKSEDARPESPTTEKKEKLTCRLSIKRRPSGFHRTPLYCSHKLSIKEEEKETTETASNHVSLIYT